MANIKLKGLLTEAEDFKARSKETGKLVHFKSKDAYQAALKAGSHEDPKAEKDKGSKVSTKPNDMFGGDYAKDRGGEAPKADVKSIVKGILKTADKEFAGTHKLKDITDDITVDTSDNDGKELQARIDKGEDGIYVQTGETEGTVVFKDGTQYQFSHVEDGPIPVTKVGGNASNAEKSKYDDKSYWKDKEYGQGSQSVDDDGEDDDDSWGSGPLITSNRLDKIENALEDELKLDTNGYETSRESSGGGGGWEGPMTIYSKDADYDSDDFVSLSVGSPNNDGKYSIVFANANGEPHFEPDWDALTGDIDLEPQQAYNLTKTLMKMPEVEKLLKGEIKIDEFQPIYDKLKSKFSKTKAKKESTKLTSMIKR